jgi:hypothetical protein
MQVISQERAWANLGTRTNLADYPFLCFVLSNLYTFGLRYYVVQILIRLIYYYVIANFGYFMLIFGVGSRDECAGNGSQDDIP